MNTSMNTLVIKPYTPKGIDIDLNQKQNIRIYYIYVFYKKEQNAIFDCLLLSIFYWSFFRF